MTEKIDLGRLRKRAGMSQRELANILQVRPSFLSAIENGRSRIPEEKLEKIKEIFELDSLDDYIMAGPSESVVPPHSHIDDQSDSFTHLLSHFHDLAHKKEKAGSSEATEMAARIDYLSKRNDRLSDRIDGLRDEVDHLREENLRLKELLVKNGISY